MDIGYRSIFSQGMAAALHCYRLGFEPEWTHAADDDVNRWAFTVTNYC